MTHLRNGLAQILVAGAMLLPVNESVWANDLEDGLAAYQQRDYETALRLLKPLAEGGEVAAQRKIGYMYQSIGIFGPDIQEAEKWYQLAAEQGQADDQRQLGDLYRYYFDEPNYEQAAKWYGLAAHQGDRRAQFDLGAVHYTCGGASIDLLCGLTTLKNPDYTIAAKWFRLSAEQGYADAQMRLGVMYYTGEGVPQDFAQAHMWLNLAAAQGDQGWPSAAEMRDAIGSEMSTQQIQEAQRLSREWLKMHPQ